MTGIFALLMAAVMVIDSQAHDITSRGCKNPPGMPNFDPTLYSGRWNILRVDHGVNKCLSQLYTPSGDGFRVVQSRNAIVGDKIKLPDVTGSLEPEGPLASQMHVEWQIGGRLNDMTYTVIDTDYSSYALTYECEKIFNLGGLQLASESLAIMSRDTVLADTTIESLLAKAKSYGIGTNNVRIVNHDNCV